MQTLQFKLLDGRSFTGNVRNGSATLGSVAKRLAARTGLPGGGTFELIDEKRNVTLDPQSKLEDLPDTTTVVMSPELTPATPASRK